jgi:hypothetical protein
MLDNDFGLVHPDLMGTSGLHNALSIIGICGLTALFALNVPPMCLAL